MTPRELAIVPPHVGAVSLHESPPSVRRGPRSYAHDGRCLECVAEPGYALAVDAEAFTAPAGRYLAERLGLAPGSFLALWTRIEVTAKLTGVPAAALLQRVRAGGRLPRAELQLRTVVEGDMVVSAGWVRTGRGSEARS